MCKRGDTFSLQVLIGRGLFLFLHASLFSLRFLCLFSFKVGVNCSEVTPVPIPNTEVKLWYEEDTWLATTRENISMPAFYVNGSSYASVFHITSFNFCPHLLISHFFFEPVHIEIMCEFSSIILTGHDEKVKVYWYMLRFFIAYITKPCRKDINSMWTYSPLAGH